MAQISKIKLMLRLNELDKLGDFQKANMVRKVLHQNINREKSDSNFSTGVNISREQKKVIIG